MPCLGICTSVALTVMDQAERSEAAALSEKAIRLVQAQTDDIIRIVGENAFGYTCGAARALCRQIEETELLCRRCEYFLLRCSAGTIEDRCQRRPLSMQHSQAARGAAAKDSAAASRRCGLAYRGRNSACGPPSTSRFSRP